MPVQGDSSIVPDSTFSSSLPSTPIVVKRAPRTYGRQRTDVAGGDSDTSLLQSAKSPSSLRSIYRTGPLDIDEEVPPSSDPAPEHSISSHVDDDDGEDNAHDATSSFQFSWKQKLKEIDAGDDDDLCMADGASKERVELGHPSALSPQGPDSSDVPHIPTFPVESSNNTVAEVLFGGSNLAASSPLSHTSRTRSPSPQLLSRRGRKKVAVVNSSESEEGENKESSPTSPRYPHPITTPRLYSSPTPPTSSDDMAVSLKYDVKGKGKSRAPVRPNVVPLRFSEAPAPTTTKAHKSSKDIGGKRQKIKAPTKKELKETARNRLRIAADQQISIPRAEGTSKYSIQGLFVGITNKQDIEADPIVDFSSDRHTSPPYVAPSPPALRQSDGSPLRSPKRTHTGPLKAMHPLPMLADDLDEDLPEVGALVEKEQEAHDVVKRRQRLLLLKQQAIAMQSTTKLSSDEEDDELQIVQTPNMQMAIKEEDIERKSGRKKRISEGRKRQLNLGGIGLSKQKAKENPPRINELDLLRQTGTQQGKKGDPQMTPAMLNQIMMSRVNTKRQEVVRTKEEEWVRRGGKIKNQDEGAASTVQEASMLYAEKGRNLPEGKGASMHRELESDEDDEDWSPDLSTQLRGSASASPSLDSGDERADTDMHMEEVTMVNDNSLVEEDETDNKFPLKGRRSVAKAIIDSDSEADDNNDNAAPTRLDSTSASPQANLDLPIFAHRGSLSSWEDPTEDEGDKENETSRMWDRGDDKENKAVVRHLALSEKVSLGVRKGSLFDLESGLARQLSMSPRSLARQGEIRAPLRNTLDDDPFTSPSRPSKLPTSFEARLKLASPAGTLSSSTPLSPAPFIGANPLGFSQFPDDDEMSAIVGPAPMQPGFSDLFESGTENQVGVAPLKRTSGNLGSFMDKTSHKKFVRAGTLDLTQDVTLQPAFEVSETFLRKADQIFEKEQEYVLEAASKKPSEEPELYVNDHGFLTQTRPNVSTPEIYRHPSPTQARALSQTEPELSLRRPLRTISLSDEVDFNTPAPLGRLRKRSRTPTSPSVVAGYISSPSVSPSVGRPDNAFDVLKRAPKAHTDKSKRLPLERSEFIEQEAQESDNDEMFGFGPRSIEKDEDEDGEELDQTLEALVDDAEMDEETVAAELVMEKFQEHEKAADEALQKLHEAAAHGELRKKRRNRGLGLEDSDDDSDDETDARIRQSMRKKQKIERGNIKELGEHEDTKSFYQVYEQNLIADDTDFAYLQESQPPDVVMADMDMDQVDDEEEPREIITTAEITRLAREAAQKLRDEDEESWDLHDVSWVEDKQSDDEDNLRVKPIALRENKQPSLRRKAPDQTEFDVGFEVYPSLDPLELNTDLHHFQALSMPPPKTDIAEQSLNRMQSWAKAEGQSRHSGTTGRNVGGAAVTGHRAKSGGGSLRRGPVAASTSAAATKSSESRKPVRAESSLIAKVAADSRTTRFG